MKHAMTILICACAIGGSLAFADADVLDTSPDIKYDDSGTRTLILLRHAKSDKDNMTMPDIERPLEASGRLEAEEMGDYLAKKLYHIDAIISSPSIRTKQTLEIICPKIGFDYSKVQWDSSLYACTGEHLQEKVKKTFDLYGTVMYVGHNPSITNTANAFQSEQTINEVKTCGVVGISFQTAFWSEVSKSNGKLWFYAKPK